MIWLQFFITAALIVLAANQLAKYGDIIAVRTGLSGMFIGTILMAGATSLPELLSAVNALSIDSPGLAAGSMFGSGMFNMFMLAVIDLLNQQSRVLRRVAMNHALTASLANLLTALAIFFVLADIPTHLGWVGVDSLVIIAAYVIGIRVLQQQSNGQPVGPQEIPEGVPTLRNALVWFGAASLVLVVVTPYMVDSANSIATITGLSSGFVGATFIGITTSLPELVATIAATRIGAFDLAVGNLFGSNLFNMFALALTDVFYLNGRFIGEIDPSFAIVGILVIILTSLGLVGNIARMERRLWFVEADALLILLGYLFGMWFLYSRGIGS